jgi:hypothetical protein
VLLLLCIAATINAYTSKELRSDSLKGNGWYGRKINFYYNIRNDVCAVTLDQYDYSPSGMNIGFGTGRATVSWTPGSRLATVHAWVNGKASWWGKKSNHIRWTVYVWYR